MINLPKELITLRNQGSLREIDIAFADLMGRITNTNDICLLIGAALVSQVLDEGHVCLDLNKYAGKNFPDDFSAEPDMDANAQTTHADTPVNIQLPALEPWITALLTATAAVTKSDDAATTLTPLVLDDAAGRLYLRRYWVYEHSVARRILNLARPISPSTKDFSSRISKLLDTPAEEGGDLQRRACTLGLTRGLAIISGGPGTGKTYTVARLVALLLEENSSTRIRLAAPTGKAANRMVQSIREAKEKFPPGVVTKETLQNIPKKSETLHRLLGASANGRTFRQNSKNPIEADVVIIDEASMIALPMMSRLLDALSAETRLILVGDKDQLASVEPGSVFGDLCDAATLLSLPENEKNTHPLLLKECFISLKYSRRFPPTHPIATISHAVHQTVDALSGQKAWEELKLYSSKKICVRKLDKSHPMEDSQHHPIHDFRELVWKGFRGLMNATTPSEAFAAFAHFRILCALHEGPYGVKKLNQLVENVLSLKGILDPESHKNELQTHNLLSPKPMPTFYERQAIMVTQNNYEFNLFNGDMGVVFKNEHGQLAGYFETHDKEGARSERSIPVSLIPPCVTAFATTIHKSQGSEFSNLMIVLPPKYTPILSKELIYTAITRVKPDPKNPDTTGAIDLWCTEEIFKRSALNATNRTSGLKEALHRLQFQTEIGVSV